MFNRLQIFDANPKTQEVYKTHTWHGGIASLLALSFLLYLLITDYNLHFKKEYIQKMYVDNSRNPKAKINFSLTFPKMHCLLFNVDASTISGSEHKNIEHGIHKTRLNEKGEAIGESAKLENIGETIKNETSIGGEKEEVSKTKGAKNSVKPKCGSCYNAGEPGQCCNTCKEVQDLYTERNWAFPSLHDIEQCNVQEFEEILNGTVHEGCNIRGFVEVTKVAGSLTFAPGKIFNLGYISDDLLMKTYDIFNNSHVIDDFAIGYENAFMKSTLNQRTKELPQGKHGIYQYFLKVVSRDYTFLNETKKYTTQYSVTEHFRELLPKSNKGLPGVTINYDFSPIMFHVVEQRGGVLPFLVSTCSVIGGILTVTGFVDSMIDKLITRWTRLQRVPFSP